MNTPAHLIFGAAAFARPGRPAESTAAIIGALLPDLSLYLLAGWHLFILGTPPETVFGELYFSESWGRVFRIDNSFILWGIALAVGLALKNRVVIALTGAALLHLAFDFPLHHDDGRPHFWPLTSWIFESPVSYWDRRHYGEIVGPIEIGVCLILCLVLWRRFDGWIPRGLILLAGATQLLPLVMWAFVFGGP
ncbi:cobalamin biosynthesis protein CobQ [Pelagovum pacificum]|uniref:Cobalamin biosynthesis protein CobQ n=1 Tax=Pelagovum pacificum TaxID=2588711 RepID=A0A5C5G808_9RHOB|nr:cobalamin biosynthesis protein CobQ [Pelagovum pacificum]QQA41559.1 cobalamin biosynthesis protein CobQ [Pelagovum pacificum]TNY30839.1 cobalamin biosynthesis protein CobQ [Pelagovum pacificum]